MDCGISGSTRGILISAHRHVCLREVHRVFQVFRLSTSQCGLFTRQFSQAVKHTKDIVTCKRYIGPGSISVSIICSI